MNRLTFYFVIALSLVYVVLIGLETWMDQTWDITVYQQKVLQARVVNAQRIHFGAQQLLRRIAVESEHDPALLELLKKNKIKVNFKSAPDSSTNAAPAAPDHP